MKKLLLLITSILYCSTLLLSMNNNTTTQQIANAIAPVVADSENIYINLDNIDFNNINNPMACAIDVINQMVQYNDRHKQKKLSNTNKIKDFTINIFTPKANESLNQENLLLFAAQETEKHLINNKNAHTIIQKILNFDIHDNECIDALLYTLGSLFLTKPTNIYLANTENFQSANPDVVRSINNAKELIKTFYAMQPIHEQHTYNDDDLLLFDARLYTINRLMVHENPSVQLSINVILTLVSGPNEMNKNGFALLLFNNTEIINQLPLTTIVLIKKITENFFEWILKNNILGEKLSKQIVGDLFIFDYLFMTNNYTFNANQGIAIFEKQIGNLFDIQHTYINGWVLANLNKNIENKDPYIKLLINNFDTIYSKTLQ